MLQDSLFEISKMAEFNLIPLDFVEAQRKRHTAVVLACALALSALLCGGGWWFWQRLLEQAEAEVVRLSEQRELSLQQQQRLGQLTQKKNDLEQQILLLNSLRAGAPLGELTQTIESAVNDTDVWFVSWDFRRQGIVVEDDPIPRSPSYFIMADNAKAFPKRWEHMTHMNVRGEARDHAALSTFVQRLFAHPTVDDVRVQRSERDDVGVRFHLAVVVRTRGVS